MRSAAPLDPGLTGTRWLASRLKVDPHRNCLADADAVFVRLSGQLRSSRRDTVSPSARSVGALLPSPSAAHSAAHRATEILRSLLPHCTCLLLLLHAELGFGRRLPSTAGVLGPIATLPVVPIDVTVLSCVNIVRTRGDTGA